MKNMNNIPTYTPAMESAKHMLQKVRIGWNLGNALDACGIDPGSVSELTDYETQWHNPPICPSLFQTVHEAGYQAVRIPVTYFEHMDQDGNIDIAWLNRVKTVIDYVLDNDMYCITNVHHDTGAGLQAWLKADITTYTKVRARFIKLWTQIAVAFKDYGEKLIFESFNEMLDARSAWDYTDPEGYECINLYHQDFVDTIRQSGGCNLRRNLLLNTYGASPMEAAAQAFRLPSDIHPGHLMVGVHFYKPDAFTSGDMQTWNSEGEKEVDAFFQRMDKYFLNKNIPVIMGECGTHDIRTQDQRTLYVKSVLSYIKNRPISYFWWDDGDHMKLIDRLSEQIIYKKLQAALTDAAGKAGYEQR